MSRWLTCLTLGAVAGLVISAKGHSAQATDGIKLSYKFAAYGYSASQRFSRPSGLFYDSDRSELYVADSGNGQIVILDKKGMPVNRIPHSVVDQSSGDRRTGEPRSIVVRKNGDIVIADNLCNYLEVLDFHGRSVQKLWPAELVGLPRSKVQPRCLAQDDAGNVYVGVSGGTNEIIVLTSDLKLKTQMGAESGGESRGVTGLWVDKAGRVYATYAAGVCVRVYAPDGKQLLSFGSHDSGPEGFSLPSGLVTDAEGRLWVSDTLRCVVSVFRLEPASQGLKGSFLSFTIGGMGQSAGDLSYPSAIAGDGVTRVYTLESTGARVQAFEIVPDSGSGKSN